MELEQYLKILNNSKRIILDVSLDIKRPLIDKIDWRDRLIFIKGSRGVGKTTLILQHIKENFSSDLNKSIYISLDNLFFETNDVLELIDIHVKNGGTHVFIDEVHYKDNWQLLIKNIYDNYPKLNIVYTGSSLLKIDASSGDLSRRQIVYEMPGLSFREYLKFEKIIDIESISLNDLLENHEKIAGEYFMNKNILLHFRNYLNKGYYPFYKSVYAGYEERIKQIINQILENDYLEIEKISYSTIQKIKKMLKILAENCPQTPVMSDLYKQLETDRNQGLKMLKTLSKAKLLNLLSSEKASLKNMSKPEKIYCDNPNIMYALCTNVNKGTLRETFFLNQLLSSGYIVTYPNKGDFIVDEKYLFEVGGKTKTFEQIKDIENSYLALDDIEIGNGNRIPLWMFGLLY